jgi:hypothetical protein
MSLEKGSWVWNEQPCTVVGYVVVLLTLIVWNTHKKCNIGCKIAHNFLLSRGIALLLPSRREILWICAQEGATRLSDPKSHIQRNKITSELSGNYAA